VPTRDQSVQQRSLVQYADRKERDAYPGGVETRRVTTIRWAIQSREAPRNALIARRGLFESRREEEKSLCFRDIIGSAESEIDDFDSSLSSTATRQTIGKQSRADISAERCGGFTAVCTDAPEKILRVSDSDPRCLSR